MLSDGSAATIWRLKNGIYSLCSKIIEVIGIQKEPLGAFQLVKSWGISRGMKNDWSQQREQGHLPVYLWLFITEDEIIQWPNHTFEELSSFLMHVINNCGLQCFMQLRLVCG